MTNAISIILNSHIVNIDRLIFDLQKQSVALDIIVVDVDNHMRNVWKNVKVVKNDMPGCAYSSNHLGLCAANQPVSLVIDSCVEFKSFAWIPMAIDYLQQNPKNVICPVYVANKGSCGNKLYGGTLSILKQRPGGIQIFDIQWNREKPINNFITCSMGKAYVVTTDWHRKIGSWTGIKGLDAMANAVSFSLKARLAGGEISICNEWEAKCDIMGTPAVPYLESQDVYNIMRSAWVLFPSKMSMSIHMLLSNYEGFLEASNAFVSDYQELVFEKNNFWNACKRDPRQAMKHANIDLGIPLL